MAEMRICEIEERVTAIIAEDILQKYEIVKHLGITAINSNAII